MVASYREVQPLLMANVTYALQHQPPRVKIHMDATEGTRFSTRASHGHLHMGSPFVDS